MMNQRIANRIGARRGRKIQESTAVELTPGQEAHYREVLNLIGSAVTEDINGLLQQYGIKQNGITIGLTKTPEDFEANLHAVVWNFLSSIYTPYEIVSMCSDEGLDRDEWESL